MLAGIFKAKKFFYANDKRYPRKPDNVILPPEKILEAGECGFSYVMVEENGKQRGMSKRDNGALPLLLAPLVSADGVFEKNSYEGQGVYIRIDGAAKSERLRKSDQKILSIGGKTLLENGNGTLWGTKLKPIVLLPER